MSIKALIRKCTENEDTFYFGLLKWRSMLKERDTSINVLFHNIESNFHQNGRFV